VKRTKLSLTIVAVMIGLFALGVPVAYAGPRAITPPAGSAPTDLVAPVTVDDSDLAVYATFTLTLTATDDSSGVESTWYKVDGGAWRTGEYVTLRMQSIRHKLCGLPAGDHVVEYCSVDVAGNEELTQSCIVTLGR